MFSSSVALWVVYQYLQARLPQWPFLACVWRVRRRDRQTDRQSNKPHQWKVDLCHCSFGQDICRPLIWNYMWLRKAFIPGDLKWISKSFTSYSTYCKCFQVGFFVQLCSSGQDLNWHRASRRPSAIAEYVAERRYHNAINCHVHHLFLLSLAVTVSSRHVYRHTGLQAFVPRHNRNDTAACSDAPIPIQFAQYCTEWLRSLHAWSACKHPPANRMPV